MTGAPARQQDEEVSRAYTDPDKIFRTIDWLSDPWPERHHLVDIQPDPALLSDIVFKRVPFELVAAIGVLAQQPGAIS